MIKPKALWSNARALFAIQISNYIIPFLIFPYLTYRLGPNLFGVVAFGLSLAQTACIITDYGFNLSATYKIAKHQSDKEKIKEIHSAVIICKIGLTIFVGILLSLFISFKSQYSEYNKYFLLLIIPIIGQTFQPIWLFQGIEKMSYITIYTIISRLTYILLTITLIKSAKDYFLIAISLGISNISAAAIGFYMLAKMGFSFKRVSLGCIKNTFRESTEFFWSRAAVATYTAGGALIVGISSTPVQVAYYSAAEQIYKGGQAIFSPLAQALYPYMAKGKNISLFFRILRISIIITILGAITVAFLGKLILTTVFGSSFIESYPILIIFLITFIINTPSVLIGYPFTGALGNSRQVNISVLYGGATQMLLLCACYMLELTQAIYISITVLIAELVVLIIRSKNARRTYLSALEVTH